MLNGENNKSCKNVLPRATRTKAEREVKMSALTTSLKCGWHAIWQRGDARARPLLCVVLFCGGEQSAPSACIKAITVHQHGHRWQHVEVTSRSSVARSAETPLCVSEFAGLENVNSAGLFLKCTCLWRDQGFAMGGVLEGMTADQQQNAARNLAEEQRQENLGRQQPEPTDRQQPLHVQLQRSHTQRTTITQLQVPSTDAPRRFASVFSNPSASATDSVNLPSTSGYLAGNRKEQEDEEASTSTDNTASSTSGCSSLVPSDHLQRFQIPKESIEKLRKELGKPDTVTKIKSACIAFQNKNLSQEKKTFLWSDTSTSRTFNPSKFLAPNSMLPSATRSPFYAGKTAYGGAAARRANRLAATNPYNTSQRVAPTLRVQVGKKAPESKDNLSTAAKRILESMEKVTTPFEEPKRAPLRETGFPSSYFRSRLNPLARTSKSAQSDVPSQPPLKTSGPGLKWDVKLNEFFDKQRAKDSNAQTTKHKLYDQDQSEKAGGKMAKLSKSSGRVSSRVGGQLEVAEEVVLPAVSLPTPLSLPSFNFTKSTNDVATDLPKPSSQQKPKTNVTLCVDEDDEIDAEFQFSAPLSTRSDGNKSFSDVDSSIKFSSPVGPTTKKPTFSATPDQTVPKRASLGAHKIEEPPTTSFQCSPKVAEVLKTGSVTDILGKSTSSSSSNVATPPTTASSGSWAFKPVPGSWSCSTCMLNNTGDKDACPSCETPKPGSVSKTNPASTAAPATNSWGTLAAKPSGWECPTCCVNNKEADLKCVCCQEAKPGTKNEEPISAPFVAPFKNVPLGWECDTCSVRNPEAAVGCVSCGNQRVKTSLPELKPAFSGFDFSKMNKPATTPSFKFGIQEANDKPVSSPSFASISSTASTLTAKTPVFPVKNVHVGWECDTCKAPNQEVATGCVTCGKPRVKANLAEPKPPAFSGFNFLKTDTDVNKPAITTPFKFGLPEANDKPVSSPTFASISTTASTPMAKPSVVPMKNVHAGWDCDKCTARNQEEAVGCATCGNQRVKENLSELKPAFPGFNFSKAVSDVNKPALSTPFKFGAQAEANDKPKASFTFASTPTTTASLPTIKPFFGGLSSTEPPKSLFGGSPAIDSSQSVFGKISTTEAPKLTFGSAPTPEPAATMQRSVTSTPFVFGSLSSKNSAPSTGATFQFGQAPSSLPAVPTFGQPLQQMSAAPASSMPQPGAFNMNPNFNFSQPTGGPSVFQFS